MLLLHCVDLPQVSMTCLFSVDCIQNNVADNKEIQAVQYTHNTSTFYIVSKNHLMSITYSADYEYRAEEHYIPFFQG